MDGRIAGIVWDSLPKIVTAGLCYTIPLTIVTFIIGLLVAILVALVRTRRNEGGAKGHVAVIANLPWTMLDTLCRLYVWVFRGTPLMVQLFIAFYGLPHVGIRWGAVTCAVIVLSLNIGAYASETVRGSVMSLPDGQYEASLSVGMSHWQAMAYVILPQALRAAVPALSNTFISLVKDTSLVANITVAEMLMTTQRIVAVTYEPLILYIEVALVYLGICTVLSFVQHRVEFLSDDGGNSSR